MANQENSPIALEFVPIRLGLRLAAALAAGETPSPEMVAAAGETSGLAPRIAMACLTAILIGLAGAVYATIRHSALDRMGVEQSPDVLTQKAREMIARFGYAGRPEDSFFDFDYDMDFVRYVEQHEKPRPQWDQILTGRPSVLEFLYRQSPEPLVAGEFHSFPVLTPGMVDQNDPAPTLSGMIRLQLDPQGRLAAFEAIPPERISQPGAATPPFDWKILFSAADLDPTQFQMAPPMWNSLASSDTRAAWTGKWPGTEWPLRIEAAAFQGKPVYFYLIGEWTQPPRMQSPPESAAKKASEIMLLVLAIALMVGAMWLARRNHRQGRGDQQGALLLAKIMFGLMIALWLLRSHLAPAFGTLMPMVLAISTALFLSGSIFVMYLALEPYVRRYWPQAMISWSRLLTGRVRDPLVGRDLLFGVLLGVIWVVLFKVARLAAMSMGAAPELLATDGLTGTRRALGAWLYLFPSSILGTLEYFLFILALKVALKRDWLATAVFVAIFATAALLNSSSSQYLALNAAIMTVIYLILALIVYRFGLVPLACAIFTVDLLVNVAFTGDLSAWYFDMSLFALLSVVALTLWGFYHSLGGEAWWQGNRLDHGARAGQAGDRA